MKNFESIIEKLETLLDEPRKSDHTYRNLSPVQPKTEIPNVEKKATLETVAQDDINRKKIKDLLQLNSVLDSQLNDKNENGDTLLMAAVKLNKPMAVQNLLLVGIDPNIVDQKGIPAIIRAMQIYKKTKNVSQNFGAKQISEAQKAGIIVDKLITAGADLDYIDANGNTVLHWIAAAGLRKVLFQMIQNKSSFFLKHLNSQNKEKMTPLSLALKEKEIDNANLLIAAQADVNIPNRNGETAVHYVYPMVRYLAEVRVFTNSKDIECTVLSGEDKFIDKPLATLMRSLSKYAKDFNPNHQVDNHFILLAALKNNLSLTAMAIIEAGGNINQLDKEGFPPLYYAKYGSVISKLLQEGADTYITQSSERFSLIHYGLGRANFGNFTSFLKYDGIEALNDINNSEKITTFDYVLNGPSSSLARCFTIQRSPETIEIAKNLINAGADPMIGNALDTFTRTSGGKLVILGDLQNDCYDIEAYANRANMLQPIMFDGYIKTIANQIEMNYLQIVFKIKQDVQEFLVHIFPQRPSYPSNVPRLIQHYAGLDFSLEGGITDCLEENPFNSFNAVGVSIRIIEEASRLIIEKHKDEITKSLSSDIYFGPTQYTLANKLDALRAQMYLMLLTRVQLFHHYVDHRVFTPCIIKVCNTVETPKIAEANDKPIANEGPLPSSSRVDHVPDVIGKLIERCTSIAHRKADEEQIELMMADKRLFMGKKREKVTNAKPLCFSIDAPYSQAFIEKTEAELNELRLKQVKKWVTSYKQTFYRSSK